MSRNKNKCIKLTYQQCDYREIYIYTYLYCTRGRELEKVYRGVIFDWFSWGTCQIVYSHKHARAVYMHKGYTDENVKERKNMLYKENIMFYLDLGEINEPASSCRYPSKDVRQEETSYRGVSLVINCLVKINALPFDGELISRKHKKKNHCF